ncbi:uncharacterized protein LOC134211430 [Armigeres subalbatus]|uniref:uncharacterized protein LOC134211430 n=1 Tax=Armigeres subalbatus TaxID=124917 RepID=UPI002ED10734
MKCIVSFCQNVFVGGLKNITFFRFPKNNTIKQRWIQFCKLPDNYIVTDNSRICSLHFNYEDLYRISENGRLMRLPNSVPIYEIVANFGTGVSDPPNVVGMESTSKDSLGTSSGTTLTAFSTECSQPSKTVEK